MNQRAIPKPECMAKDVIYLTRNLVQPNLLRSWPASYRLGLQSTAQFSLGCRKLFSTSSSTLLPRTRHKESSYPAFRTESKEQRYVREHNLFDPPDHDHLLVGDIPRLSPGLEHGRAPMRQRSTLPRSLTPSSDLERELLYLSSRYPTEPRARNLLHMILVERKERPNAIHFEALILANTSPEYGSAENIQNLIQEMETLGIVMNANLYVAILRTLVVHPDVEILNKILEACEKMWIEVDSEMRHLICAIYLRAGMSEIALQQLEQIEFDGGTPLLGVSRSGLQRGKAELWLYVMFIQHLVDAADWEGVMRFCYRLVDDTSAGIPLASRHLDVPYAFWGWLLEKAAFARDKWVTFWIWNNWVLKAWVKPSSETCVQVLRVCADEGATRIAETVAAILRFLPKEKMIGTVSATKKAELPEAPSQRLVRELLETAHKNASSLEPRPTDTEVRRMTAAWWMFDIEDRIGLGPSGQQQIHSLRINPWAVLRGNLDPGQSWARILSERDEMEKRREQREALRQANVHRAMIQAGHTTMMKSLPIGLLKDIERAANADYDRDEHTQAAENMSADFNLANLVSGKSSRPTPHVKSQPKARIRLVESKKLASEDETLEGSVKPVSVAKSKSKSKNGKKDRAWVLDHSVDAGSEKVELPRVRLFKFAETSSDPGWHSKWSKMLLSKRRARRYGKARSTADKA